MNNQGANGVATAILLISFILIGATAASVIMSDSVNKPQENYEEILENAIDEVSTYIQIIDVLGKYNSATEEGKYNSATEEQYIQKIAILIKPLFSIDIDASELMIKLNNGKEIKMLYYNRQAKFISSNSLFEHTQWTTMRNTDFGFIVLLDKDKSITDYGTINDNTDMTYIIIQLPNDFTMKKGDSLEITLFPSIGITKTIHLKAPLPIKQIVSLN
jgi:archaellin